MAHGVGRQIPQSPEPASVREALRKLTTEDNYQNLNSDEDERVCCKKVRGLRMRCRDPRRKFKC